MWISTSPTSPPIRSSARSSEFRPIAHHGHATSDTKSILIAGALGVRRSLLAFLLELGRELDEHLRGLRVVELRHREVSAALEAPVRKVHGAHVDAGLLPHGHLALERVQVARALLRVHE